MPNKDNFTIDSAALQEAVTALKDIPQKYRDALDAIQKATEPLLEKENWSGNAREEFKDTYRIVEHYLEDDLERTSNIVDIINGFKEIYEAADDETAKKMVESVSNAVNTLTGGSSSK